MTYYDLRRLNAAIEREAKRAYLRKWRDMAGHWRQPVSAYEAETRVREAGREVLSIVGCIKNADGSLSCGASGADLAAAADLLREIGIDPDARPVP